MMTSLTDLTGFMRGVEQVSVVADVEIFSGSEGDTRGAEERAEDLTDEASAMFGW